MQASSIFLVSRISNENNSSDWPASVVDLDDLDD